MLGFRLSISSFQGSYKKITFSEFEVDEDVKSLVGPRSSSD